MKNTLLGFHIFGVSRQCLGRYVKVVVSFIPPLEWCGCDI